MSWLDIGRRRYPKEMPSMIAESEDSSDIFLFLPSGLNNCCPEPGTLVQGPHQVMACCMYAGFSRSYSKEQSKKILRNNYVIVFIDINAKLCHKWPFLNCDEENWNTVHTSFLSNSRYWYRTPGWYWILRLVMAWIRQDYDIGIPRYWSTGNGIINMTEVHDFKIAWNMPSVQWTVLSWSHSHRGLDYQVKRMLKPMLVTQDFLICQIWKSWVTEMNF